jgi:ornithine cyclodeaminase
LVTKWKTIADSLLGAKILARPDSKHLLVIGAGHVAQHAISGYLHMFPNLEKISVHARSKNSVEALIQSFSREQPMVCAVDDLRKTVGQADIIVTATTSQQPVVKGAWLKPGVHLDLIGAFKIDMREVDDEALLRARVFVDARETVLEHIGELAIPIAQGIITPDYLLGDLYDLVHGYCGRTNEKDITLYKNGGGAHLDLMIAHEIQKFL